MEFASTEIETEAAEVAPPPLAVEVEAPRKDKADKPDRRDRRDREETKRQGEEEDRKASGVHLETKKLHNTEQKALREIIESFGEQGTWRCKIKRTSPDEIRDPTTQQMVTVSGYLKTMHEPFDEDYILQRWGGGKYTLEFTAKQASGKFDYAGNKTVIIAGSPNLADLPKSVSPLAAPTGAPAGEPTSVVTKAMDLMKETMQRAEERADKAASSPREAPRGPDPAMQGMIEMLRDELASSRDTIRLLQTEMRELGNKAREPVKDPVKDTLLEKLMTDDSARLHAVRMTYESEIRQTKESAAADLRRERDEHVRELERIRSQHTMELSRLEQSFQREIAAMKASHEIQLAAAKGSFETSMKLTEAENRRLERDYNETRIEVKDLRAKKEKSLIETIKEVKTVKDALGLDDDDKETKEETNVDKILGAVTNPATWELAGTLLNKKKEDPAPQQQQQPQRPQVLKGPNGQRFVLQEGQLIPVKKKKQPAQVAAPTPSVAQQAIAEDGVVAEGVEQATQEAQQQPEEEQLPDVPQEDLDNLVRFLESAFGAGTAADTVAQGLRPRIPEAVQFYLRDRMAEMGVARGVDLFLAKVAKLPSTSTLATQLGRNWIRDVARALVGME